MGSLICPNAKSCSGCSQWDLAFESQLENKRKHLQQGLEEIGSAALPEINILSPGPMKIRDRLDFVIEEGRAGLYSKSSQQIVDLPECYLLTPQLQQFYSEFRKIRWPITKGSFRLRISPTGERGIWLDFSNLDVKSLIDEQRTLRRLLDLGFVEIGQRRKSLRSNEAKLFLADPELRVWSQAVYLNSKVPLYSCVGSFSQTGDLANHLLTQRIFELAAPLKAQRILEYGSGSGNLSFPTMSPQSHLFVLENDELALEGLFKAASQLSLDSRIEVLKPKEKIEFDRFNLILANPPRSGINDLLQKMLAAESLGIPEYFIYVSCFAESFLKDAKMLQRMNYQIENLDILDQFPQSTHYEIISLWRKT